MKSLAIDLVLIPEEEVAKKLIEWNNKLPYDFEDEIVLGPDAVPHITLRMCSLKESEFDILPSIVDSIGEHELTIDRLYLIDRINRKTWFAGFQEETPLSKIHTKLMNTKIGGSLSEINSSSFADEVIIDRTVNYVPGF